jgi:hypothetical protein
MMGAFLEATADELDIFAISGLENFKVFISDK